MNIYYLGPAGSFTEEAASQIFSPRDLKSTLSIEEVLESVKKESDTLGVVPVENSLEGIVVRTLDLILQNNLRVIAEINLPIKQNLLSKEKSLKDIQIIYSHPHALAQVRIWIKKHLPQAELKETSSTSAAAKIAIQESHSAAIASESAAKIYQLDILSRNISYKNFTNITRFWVVSRHPITKLPNYPITNYPNTKTSIYIIIKDKVGALRDLLDTFARSHISLTAIQSRPLPQAPWQYGFFIDLLVDANDPLFKIIWKQMQKEHPVTKILGSCAPVGVFNHLAIRRYNLGRIETIFKINSQNKLIKEQIQKAVSLFKTLGRKKRGFISILNIRFLIIPSVALYKYQHRQIIEDAGRERQLLQNTKNCDILHNLYLKVMNQSKKLQAEIISLLQKQEIGRDDIISFDIKTLRYYIDYLDELAINF